MTSRQKKRKFKRKLKWGCGDSIPHPHDQLGKVKEKGKNKRSEAVWVRSHSISVLRQPNKKERRIRKKMKALGLDLG